MTTISITRKINVRDPAALPDWVNSTPFVWVEVPNSKLSDCPVTWAGPGDHPPGTLSAKFTAWNGLTLKTTGSVVMLGASGGHGDYAGNEVNGISINRSTAELMASGWTELCPSSANDDIINHAIYYKDLKASSIHTYWSLQFDNANNRMIRFSKSGLFMGGIPDADPEWPYPAGAAHLPGFDVTTGEWLAPGTLAAFTPGGITDYSMCCRDYSNDYVYWVASGGYTVWRYRPAPFNDWTSIGLTNNGTSYCGTAVDSLRKRILKIGSYSSSDPGYTPKVFDITAGENVPATFGGLGTTPLSVATQYPGVIYDPICDAFFVIQSGATNIALYRVEAGTWNVTAPIMTGSIPVSPPNGINGRVQYVPELGGIVMMDGFSLNLKFMRTA